MSRNHLCHEVCLRLAATVLVLDGDVILPDVFDPLIGLVLPRRAETESRQRRRVHQVVDACVTGLNIQPNL